MRKAVVYQKINLQKSSLLFRLFFIVCISFLMSGCATGLKKEVRQLEANIQQDKQTLAAARNWLNSNRDVYDGNGGCSTPERGERPKFSCETKTQARETGLALCAASYKGCSVVVNSLGNQLDSWDKQFLASEMCEQALAELTGESRSSLATIADGTLEYAKDRCKNGGFFGKVLGCSTAFVGEVVKFSQFSACVNGRTEECYNNYDNWINGPTRRKEECKRNLVLIPKINNSLSYNSKALRKKKDSFMWKLFGDH